MIPKTIHYCWFGGNPLPGDALKCIESWRKYCPNYEIKEWNESNFDFSDCQYAMEAYNAGKWAFVSDYARFKILYEYGGLYFDTDVEVIRLLDDLVAAGPFMGFESGTSAAPGLGLAANPGLGFYKTMIDKYKLLHFLRTDGTYNLKTIVVYTTEELIKAGLQKVPGIQTVSGITLYPSEYFCPKDCMTGILNITDNTYSIHHFKASWYSELQTCTAELTKKFCGKMPRTVAEYLAALLANLKINGVCATFSLIIREILRRHQNS